MAATFLFRFTPSVMEAEALEAVFVQREEIVQRILDLTRESALTSSKHHTLLIGPRGIGKTHGVSLVYHRVKALEDLREKLLIAWMREEEWGITTLLDLIMRIFRALSAEYKDTGFDERVEALYSLPTDHIETAAGKLLKEYVGDRTLLILIENLDDIFQGLGDEGQKRLRAYIQENPFFTIVATAQSLFNGVSLQTSPFYGFFHIQHLEGLSFEESTQLLASIARYRNDPALESFIRTPTGRARIRAVNHLAGGNHRVYVIFSQFLTRESLDELVEPFLRMLDDLTPYYQDRMRWLSPQQRKIVEFLLNRRSPATVKEISQRCFMTHQTASGQLKVLREMEYVQADALGRESYYELREPLMRLCVEVKKSRGEPIGLFIDFLRFWYPKDELQQRLELIQPDATLERQYLLSALSAIEQEPSDPRLAACFQDFSTYLNARAFEEALKVAEELSAIAPSTVPEVWLMQSYLFGILGRFEEALDCAEKVIEIEPDQSRALNPKANALVGLNRNQEAFELMEKAIRIEPTDHLHRIVHANALSSLQRWDEALASYDEAIRLKGDDAHIWLNRGKALEALERYTEGIESYEKAIDLNPKETEPLVRQAIIRIRIGLFNEALSSSDRGIELSNGRDSSAWAVRGLALMGLSRTDEGLSAVNQAVSLDQNNARAWVAQGFVLAHLNRQEDALRSYDQALKLGVEVLEVLFEHAATLLALGRWDEGFTGLNNALRRISEDKQIVEVDSADIVRHVFNSTSDSLLWKPRIASLIEIYDKYQLASALGVGLAKAIDALDSEMVSDAAARAWRNAWKELAGERREFQLPLRLLDVAVRYKATKDQRVLLELPIEERELLNQVFNLEEHTET